MKKLLIIFSMLIIILLFSTGLLYFSQTSQKPNNQLPNGEDQNFPTETSNTDLTPNQEGTRTGNTAVNQELDDRQVGRVFPGGTGLGDEVPIPTGVVKKIWDKPIVGVTSYGSIKGETLTARFVEQETGHVYDYNLINNVARKVSGTTILKIKRTIWGNKGQSLLLQYIAKEGDVKNYLGRISVGTTTENKMSGDHIPGKILTVTSAPPGEELVSCPSLLTLKLEQGKSNNPTETKKLQVFLIDRDIENIKETGIFDEATFAGVVKFQELYKDEILIPAGLEKGNGLVGPATRGKINTLNCEKSGQIVTGGRLAYLENTETGGYQIRGIDFDNKNPRAFFSTMIEELNISWPNKNILAIASKANSQTYGQAFLLPSTKIGMSLLSDVSTPILRNIKGLTININPNTSKVVYGESGPRGYQTKILDIATGETRAFPISTIPSEKCVWDLREQNLIYCAGPQQGLGTSEPEAWYLGLSSSQDNVYSIDTETATVSLIYSPKNIGPDISSINVSEDGRVLLFIDKNDSSLWAVYLNSF
ncbi:MAG TPA: hypothetical protein VJI73_04145 [Candidatus Paceibacterota bacterium]